MEGLESVKIGPKEYLFNHDDTGKYCGLDIITNLENGLRKRTSFWNDTNVKNVYIEKNKEM